ncbi:hypothetical protein LXA43DRAFT_37763 [Ganoderma leucocontextum]|nr:hypothetical protein LXA43DRAFT_37763 [Ganoderma leucocontextum]
MGSLCLRSYWVSMLACSHFCSHCGSEGVCPLVFVGRIHRTPAARLPAWNVPLLPSQEDGRESVQCSGVLSEGWTPMQLPL